MKNVFLIIILFCLTSSCNFLRRVKTEKVPTERAPQKYDGTYLNGINKYHTLWGDFTNHKRKDSSSTTITISTIDKKTLLISHSGISSSRHSYLIKGKLKKGGFQFKRRRRLAGIFPLVWGYRSTKFILKTDHKGNTILSEHNFGFGGILIPMAGIDNAQDRFLIKTSKIR